MNNKQITNQESYSLRQKVLPYDFLISEICLRHLTHRVESSILSLSNALKNASERRLKRNEI